MHYHESLKSKVDSEYSLRVQQYKARNEESVGENPEPKPYRVAVLNHVSRELYDKQSDEVKTEVEKQVEKYRSAELERRHQTQNTRGPTDPDNAKKLIE